MSGRDWAVILGASAGFGEAAARAFAAQGFAIYGVHLDRRGSMPQVEALVAQLRAAGVPVVYQNANAAGDDSRVAGVAALREAMAPGDRVRVLMHSLSFGSLRPCITDDPGEALARRHVEMTLDVMAHSLVYWTQDLVRADLLGHGSRVFAMTSAGSIIAWPSYGAVSAAKSALESHVRQLAIELAPRGVTVNAILAGVTQTVSMLKIPGADEIARKALERNPSGRLTRVEDVAQCLVALTQPGTQWLTGNVIRVDGGESISG